MTKEREEHGNWYIWHDPLPIAWRGADWRYVRKDATSELDVGTAESREMCLTAIDFHEEMDSPEQQEKLTKESKEHVDRMFNYPLIRQLGAGLNAARSILATNGRGFADNVLRNMMDKAYSDFQEWEKSHVEEDKE